MDKIQKILNFCGRRARRGHGYICMCSKQVDSQLASSSSSHLVSSPFCVPVRCDTRPSGKLGYPLVSKRGINAHSHLPALDCAKAQQRGLHRGVHGTVSRRRRTVFPRLGKTCPWSKSLKNFLPVSLASLRYSVRCAGDHTHTHTHARTHTHTYPDARPRSQVQGGAS